MRNFTQEQSREMYSILVEIQETLSAKKENRNSLFKLSQYEIGWLIGISEFIKKTSNSVAETCIYADQR